MYGKKPSGGGGFGGSGVPKHPEIGILGVNAGAMGIKDSTGIGIEWHIDSAPGGGNVRKKLEDGTEVKSTVTLGCATVIYSVMAPEEGSYLRGDRGEIKRKFMVIYGTIENLHEIEVGNNGK